MTKGSNSCVVFLQNYAQAAYLMLGGTLAVQSLIQYKDEVVR